MPRITIDPEILKQSLPCTFEMTVEEAHLDLMGHMNVQHYAVGFAAAARATTALMGITADYVATRRLGAFMLRNFSQYISECHLSDELQIFTRVIARSEKRYQYMHFTVNGERIAATSEILTAHADLEARRTAPFPPEIAEAIDQTIAEHNQIDWSGAPLCGILNP